jgi:ribosome biogenesis GTPase A
MTKARRELAALMPSQHVVFQVLDARLPASSTNPLIDELRHANPSHPIPTIKILTRADLADPELTAAWIRHLELTPNVRAFASTSSEPAATRKRLITLCRELGLKAGPDRPIRALLCGVPNVGKSTLFNILAERPVAAVSDRPAVTKVQQQVTLKHGMVITDSPGMMWPKIEDERGAFRLALVGSIPPTAIDFLTIAMFGAEQLRLRYPQLIVARYKLPDCPPTAEAILTEIGRRRGGLRPGGIVDLHKASEVFIHEVRAGNLGRFTLEAPPAATATNPSP